jgi:hypothetical protein
MPLYNLASSGGAFTEVDTVKITADVANSTASFADVTGLSFALAANTRYAFTFWVPFTSAATTTGIGIALNGPASPTLFVAHGTTPTTLSAASQNGMRAYDTAGVITPSVDTQDVPLLAILHGVIETGASGGTLVVRFRSEVAASAVTVKAGAAGLLVAA